MRVLKACAVSFGYTQRQEKGVVRIERPEIAYDLILTVFVHIVDRGFDLRI